MKEILEFIFKDVWHFIGIYLLIDLIVSSFNKKD